MKRPSRAARPATVRERVKEVMTQRELARRLGMSEQSLSMKLSGAVKFSAEEVFELEKHTGIPARDFARVA